MRSIQPQGNVLKQLIVDGPRAEHLKEEGVYLCSWDLTQRQVWDIELLLNGAFSPLIGYMGKTDYVSVCEDMRLTNGTLWPIPITLDVSEEFASSLSEGDRIALRHPEGIVLAVMTITDIWKPDRTGEAELVYDTADEAHPGVFHLVYQSNPVYLGGKVEGLELPPHHTFKHLRHTPAQLSRLFEKLNWQRVVGFQTRNPMHRAHVELIKRAATQAEACVLIHPAVGRTSPGDVDYFTRVRSYQAILRYCPEQKTLLSLLPLAMRMAGPREALWHAIIRRNYGCTHLIVGRDHAGPRRQKDDKPFYPPCAAQELARKYEEELGIVILAYEEMVYIEDLAEYLPRSQVPKGARVLMLSGTELRKRLREGLEIPEWYSYPEVIEELRRSYPLRSQQGFTVFFTGLPSAGKSTISQTLMAKLMEIDRRPVTLLDGDIVRKYLSSELGFSKQDRDLNVRRIGFVAGEITKNRGIAICALIAPYRASRAEVREMISQYGGFVEVYVATPLEVCQLRDRKGLYAKARAGLIKNFTGIDDPYEAPKNPEVVIDTTRMTVEEAVYQVLQHLKRNGFIKEE